MSNQYKKAGVNLESGYESVNLIKKHIQKTYTKGVMSNIGSFGGLFDLSVFNYKEPVLVSGTDGVGTKILLAKDLNIYTTIGIDCVAMCVNDCLAQGARPLFFLDYIATSKVEPKKIEDIVSGVCQGCLESGASLIGGETAEMPGLYMENDFDIAGFCVGVCEKKDLIDVTKINKGDLIIGLPSSGLHSNGFSLVRKIIKDNEIDLNSDFNGSSIGKVLLTPTKIYVKSILNCLKDIKGIAHITGGGFFENIPRILNEGQKALIYEDKIPFNPIFKFLEEKGKIDHLEMYNIFNMGIGLVLVVGEEKAKSVIKRLEENNEKPVLLGKIEEGNGVSIV